MNQHRFAKFLVLSVLLVTAFSQQQSAHADSASRSALQTPKPTSGTTPSKSDPLAGNSDFEGLTLSAKQKAEIAKIHDDMNSKRELIVKDEKLNSDQKGAMISGYSRMELGQIFNVLTPEQQRQVRQKISARKAAEQAKQKKRQPQ